LAWDGYKIQLSGVNGVNYWWLDDVHSYNECALRCANHDECNVWWFTEDYTGYADYTTVACILYPEFSKYELEEASKNTKSKYAIYKHPNGEIYLAGLSSNTILQANVIGFACDYENEDGFGELEHTYPRGHIFNTCSRDRSTKKNCDDDDLWLPDQCNTYRCFCVDKYGAKIPGSEDYRRDGECEVDPKIHQSTYDPWHDGIRPEIDDFKAWLEDQEDGEKKKWKSKVVDLVNTGTKAMADDWYDRKDDKKCGVHFHKDSNFPDTDGLACKDPKGKYQRDTENCQKVQDMLIEMGKWAGTYNKFCTYEDHRGKTKKVKDAAAKINKKYFCKAMKTYGKVNCKKAKQKFYGGLIL
jgi:hypothetical protein